MPAQTATDQAALQAADRIRQALERMAQETPALAEVLKAFAPLMAAQAALKAGLPPLDAPLPSGDPARQAQGKPLATVEDFLSVQGLDLEAYLAQAARTLLPALQEGFPALAPEAEALRVAVSEGRLETGRALEVALTGQEQDLSGLAQGAGLTAAGLAFIVLQLAKPLLERRSQAMARLVENQSWPWGTCPVCGALPELAYLKGEGGQRWLRCSLCGHHWRFTRTTCPVCANQQPEKLGFFFVEGREWERLDYCDQCGKYLVTLDVRGMDQEPAWEVAALGLVPLDLLAQQRGLKPAASCPWNRLD